MHDMVCPMRFVLVGISICLAALAWWRFGNEDSLLSSGDAGDRQQARQPGETSAGWRAQAHKAGRTVLDMFTGRYIYNAMQKGVAKPPVKTC